MSDTTITVPHDHPFPCQWCGGKPWFKEGFHRDRRRNHWRCIVIRGFKNGYWKWG